MKVVSELNIGALLYYVSYSKISFFAINEKGEKYAFNAGNVDEFASKMDSLHDELNDKMAIASGIVPQLHEFISTWGLKLIPPFEWFQHLDVLIIVPHGDLHGLPIHAINVNGKPLCLLVGVTYSSSMSLFSVCTNRNPVRKLKLEQWKLEENNNDNKAFPYKRKVVAGGIDVLGNHHKEFVQLSEIVKFYFEDVRLYGNHDITSYFNLSRNSIKSCFRTDTNVLWVTVHGFVDFFNHNLSGLLVKDDLGIAERNIPLYNGRPFWFRDLPFRAFPFKTPSLINPEVLTIAELLIENPTSLELVALIGCSTDARVMISGDSPISIAESYLHLGSASVIGSLWDLDMKFAEEWSGLFLQGWACYNLPKALSMKYATMKLYNEKWMSHPERYACLILKGDWL